VIDPGAGNTVSILTEDLTVGNSLTVSSGTFSAGGRNLGVTANLTAAGTLQATAAETITVSGNIDFSNAGDNFTRASSTVALQGAGTTLNAPQETFHNLSFESGAGTIALASLLTVANDLSISLATTLNTANNNISVSRNWSNGGSFTAGSGTVTLPGRHGHNQRRHQFQRFYLHGTGQDLQFAAGSTQTIGGTFTITGGAGAANLISLVSASLGSPGPSIAPHRKPSPTPWSATARAYQRHHGQHQPQRRPQ